MAYSDDSELCSVVFMCWSIASWLKDVSFMQIPCDYGYLKTVDRRLGGKRFFPRESNP